MLISQILDDAETIRVVARNGGKTRIINGARSVYSLAMEAARTGTGLAALIERKGFGETVDLDAAYKKGRLVSPINHPDPAHLHLTGTGLTHLGSAATRDSMHKKLSADGEEQLTDSMKMFRMGLEGGKPAKGQTGVQPEWFYKGNGTMAVAPGAPLMSPAFAQDAGEEPEIAGIYVIGDDGAPFRVGFTLSNEFSDHVTERVNYLFLAHSKLRNASFGPEILIGDLPADIRGTSRILRDGKLLWEKPFLSGEANMSHTIANLEHHHFKYSAFRQPGDVHVHMFGTATLSFADGIRTRGRRRVRDRGRGFRPAAAQPAGDRAAGEGGGEGAVSAALTSPLVGEGGSARSAETDGGVSSVNRQRLASRWRARPSVRPRFACRPPSPTRGGDRARSSNLNKYRSRNTWPGSSCRCRRRRWRLSPR